jgi:hypothetical protein
MAQLFTILAALDLLALAVTFLLGILCPTARPHLDLSFPHMMFGLFSAIGTLLVHCIIFTYFLGTGRWVKEVALAYNLPDEPYYRKTRVLKRSSFPPALTAMLVTIGTAGAGAGQDTGEWSAYVHFVMAIATIAVNLWAFRVEFRDVSANVTVLDSVLAEVDRIRAAAGLPSNAEALRQQGN